MNIPDYLALLTSSLHAYLGEHGPQRLDQLMERYGTESALLAVLRCTPLFRVDRDGYWGVRW